MLKPDVRIFFRDFGHGATPELRSFQHVGLVNGSDETLAAACFLEGNVRDALHLVAMVAHGVVGVAFVAELAWFAKIQAAE
jgi:hypothetical protein